MFKVFPWILQVILLPFFEKIRLESRYKDRLEEAKNKGMVIYTMKTHSIIALLYFNFLAIRWNLPLAEFISGISRWRLHPLEFVGRFFGKINDSPDSAEEACKRGCHMLIFLRGDQEFSPTRNEDPFSAVVDEIRKTGSQIQIVPQVFLFDRMPEEFRKSWFANLLGVRETLGFIREWFLFLRNHKKTVINYRFFCSQLLFFCHLLACNDRRYVVRHIKITGYSACCCCIGVNKYQRYRISTFFACYCQY